MNRFDSVKKSFNSLTGKTGRQAKVFRALSDWSDSVHQFLTVNELYSSHSLDTLLGRSGNAKVELVSIIHNGRPLAEEARLFKKTGIPDNVAAIVAGTESIRRYLIDPGLRHDALTQSLIDLRVDYENLCQAMEEEHQRLTS